MDHNSQIIIYKTSSGETKLDVRFDGDTAWLTQDQMASLFDKSKSTINEHIRNIYEENELVKTSTIKKFGNSEFAKKPTNFYNLDIIISVGYRVKSQFYPGGVSLVVSSISNLQGLTLQDA